MVAVFLAVNDDGVTPPPQPPVFSSVTLSGTEQEGQTLTGAYTVADSDSEVHAWWRADDNAGLNQAVISGATNATYPLVTADVGKVVSYRPVATNTTGSTEGVSSWTGVIAAAGSGLPLGPLPTGWDVMIDDTVKRLRAKWEGGNGDFAVTDGNDTDIGPFNPTAIDSVDYTITNIFTDSIGSLILKSNDGGFTPEMVGAGLRLSGGTNLRPDYPGTSSTFNITSYQSANQVTLLAGYDQVPDDGVGPISGVTGNIYMQTVTLADHLFLDEEEAMVRLADGETDPFVNGGYNVGAPGSGIPGTEPAASQVTQNAFNYSTDASTGKAAAVGTGDLLHDPWHWWGSSSLGLGYYGTYHSLIGYADWLDRTGRLDSSSFRVARVRPLNGELSRWEYNNPSGFSRIFQPVWKAFLEGENWKGPAIPLQLVINTHANGAFNSSQIQQYNVVPTVSSIYGTGLSREFSFLGGALIGAERCGDTRHVDFLTLMQAYPSLVYQWMNETSSEDYVGSTVGAGGFMMAITAMTIIQYIEWETENGRNIADGWPTQIYNASGTNYTVSLINNPWVDWRAMLLDWFKWMFNKDGLSGDTTATPINAGYFRHLSTYNGDPMIWENPADNDLLNAHYRRYSTVDGTSLLQMNAAPLYWLANELKASNYADALWLGQTADKILLSMASNYPYIVMSQKGAAKEGNQRLWYTFDGVGFRNRATGRDD